MTDDRSLWKKLTFAQRAGVQPLPSQLQPTEMSSGLRAALWSMIHRQLCEAYEHYNGHIGQPWRSILYRKFIEADHGMADDFSVRFHEHEQSLRQLFEKGTYAHIYGFLEFVLRDTNCPYELYLDIDYILQQQCAPYRVIDEDTIMPIASEEQGQMLAAALSQLNASAMAGARQHLKQAISFVTAGEWAKSITESIHSVESVARTIEPTSTTLDPALKKLASKIGMHPALKEAFGKLYGFTNDSQGIRHALIDQSAAAVDREDALFMLSACAAFTTFLINKARNVKLI